jgi:tripartite-type tricarboxylate transporter receptor subunit TctC
LQSERRRVAHAGFTRSPGQNFYVENLRGAGGHIGTGRAAQSAPNGYTVLVTGGNLTNNPFLFDHVPFDPLKDFVAVTLGAMTPPVPKVSFTTKVGDLICGVGYYK